MAVVFSIHHRECDGDTRNRIHSRTEKWPSEGGEGKKKMRQLYTVVMQCVAGSHTHIFIHRSRVEELWPCRGVLLNLSRQFPPLLTNHTHIRKQTQIDGFLFVPQSELDPGSRLNLTLTTNSNRERKYCV